MKGEENEIDIESLRLNGPQQFLAFLQPSIRVRGALDVLNHSVLVRYDGSGALYPDEILG